MLRRTSDAALAIFSDPASRAFEERLALLAPSDATVLVLGETGTGKEVAARELHARSGRRGPFLAVNCSALTETLADAELFGHEKGSFTGAVRAQAGWFEAASGGTLLLDEIGELPLPLQAKLLRVLQEREVTRVGSRTPRRIDVRVVAATNVDLAAATAAGRFRQDLLFRLNVATVALRPLRERHQDIEPLAEHFLALYGARFGRAAQTFTPDAKAALRRYRWPGNVRELDNVVHRAVLLTAGESIDAAALALPGDAGAPEPVSVGESGPAPLEGALRGMAEQWLRQAEPNLLQRATQVLVQAGFEASGGNQVKAAELLGVSRNTLRTQLGHLGVIAPRRRVQERWVRVRIGIQKFGTSALLRAGGALERQLAAREILVDWRDFATGPPLLAALHAGEIDVGSAGEVPPIFALAHGAPLVYLAYEPEAPRSVGLVVRAGGAVSGVPDLVGRRVALSRGANVHLLLLRLLEAHGLEPDDIVQVDVPAGAACSPSALADADAWVMWDPYLTDVRGDPAFRVLLDGTGLVANHRFYVARRDFAHRHPGVVDAVLSAARRAGAEAARAPATAAHMLAGSFGMRPDILETMFRNLATASRTLDGGAIRSQQQIADRFFALGLLPRSVAVADAVWP